MTALIAHPARTFVLLLLLPVLALTVPAQEVVIRKGTHFRVHCHFPDERAAKEALEIVEATWKPTVRVFGKKPPAGLIDVYVLRHASDYLEHEKEVAGRRFGTSLACVTEQGRVCYLAIQPEMDDQLFAQVGLTALTRRNLAEGAARALIRRLCKAPGALPAWIEDGAAVGIAQAVLEGKGFSPGWLKDPHTGTLLSICLDLLDGKKLPAVGRILKGELGKTDVFTVRSLHTVFFRFMSEKERVKTLRRMLARARSLKNATGAAEKIIKAGGKLLASGGFSHDFRSYIRSLEPVWTQYYPDLDCSGEDWLQVAEKETNAVAWHVEPVDRNDYVIAGRFRILSSKGRQLNILFGKTPLGFYSVAIVAGEGFGIMKFDAESSEWSTVAWRETSAIATGVALAFELRVDGEDVTIAIEGHEPLSTRLRGADLTLHWGLGAQAGSGGIWSGVTLK